MDSNNWNSNANNGIYSKNDKKITLETNQRKTGETTSEANERSDPVLSVTTSSTLTDRRDPRPSCSFDPTMGMWAELKPASLYGHIEPPQGFSQPVSGLLQDFKQEINDSNLTGISEESGFCLNVGTQQMKVTNGTVTKKELEVFPVHINGFLDSDSCRATTSGVFPMPHCAIAIRGEPSSQNVPANVPQYLNIFPDLMHYEPNPAFFLQFRRENSTVRRRIKRQNEPVIPEEQDQKRLTGENPANRNDVDVVLGSSESEESLQSSRFKIRLRTSQEATPVREARLARLRQIQRSRIEKETESERDARLAKQRERQRLRIQRETPSEREKRLSNMRRLQKLRLQKESATDREKRLAKMRVISKRARETKIANVEKGKDTILDIADALRHTWALASSPPEMEEGVSNK